MFIAELSGKLLGLPPRLASHSVTRKDNANAQSQGSVYGG